MSVKTDGTWRDLLDSLQKTLGLVLDLVDTNDRTSPTYVCFNVLSPTEIILGEVTFSLQSGSLSKGAWRWTPTRASGLDLVFWQNLCKGK